MAEELREQARQLRREGLSVAQIAERLGGRSKKTIQDWVFGVPPPEWTRRPLAKDAERARARELRLEGLTYGEIADALGVSKSSISLWTRDLPHPPKSERHDARHAGAKRYYELRRRRVHIERQNEKRAWADEIGPLSDRELLIAGAVAYWAEGSKSKPWRPSERVTFVNSDPGMIRLFMTYLEMLGVVPERLRLRIHIHESADVAAASRYWSEILQRPVSEFQRPTLKRHSPSTNRKNVGVDYHGCLSVCVLRSAALYRRIEGTWWAVRAAAERSSSQPGSECPPGDPPSITV